MFDYVAQNYVTCQTPNLNSFILVSFAQEGFEIRESIALQSNCCLVWFGLIKLSFKHGGTRSKSRPLCQNMERTKVETHRRSITTNIWQAEQIPPVMAQAFRQTDGTDTSCFTLECPQMAHPLPRTTGPWMATSRVTLTRQRSCHHGTTKSSHDGAAMRWHRPPQHGLT